jgi:hypothetical protein
MFFSSTLFQPFLLLVAYTLQKKCLKDWPLDSHQQYMRIKTEGSKTHFENMCPLKLSQFRACSKYHGGRRKILELITPKTFLHLT